jgi:hypothetical protein
MMSRRIRVLGLLAPAFALVVGASSVAAQALPNLNSTRVRYNTLKSTAKPEGELKAQIDQIDKELAEAVRAGRTGEVRRLFAKGLALLGGRTWSDVDEFQSSLVLRTPAVAVDSTQPQIVRLEQIFAPAIALSQPLTAIASIRPQTTTAAGAPAAVTLAPEASAVELGRFEQVSRDLSESPHAMDLDLSKVADGTHTLSVEVKEGERSLGTTTLRLSIHKGSTRGCDSSKLPQ